MNVPPPISRISAPCLFNNGLELDFLGYLFPRDRGTGHYKVSATYVLGELAVSLAMPVSGPPSLPQEEGKTPCVLDLPAVDVLNSCRNKWMQYSPTAMARLNRVLKACFELDFYRYYLKGLQFGYEKREIVETYVISRNLTTGDPFDTLHKRVYRKEQEMMRHKVEQLHRKARYFFNEQENDLTDRK